MLKLKINANNDEQAPHLQFITKKNTIVEMILRLIQVKLIGMRIEVGAAFNFV